MHFLPDQDITCPYCGETINVLIDAQDAGEQYIEDCQVCCRPIVFVAYESEDGELNVTVYCENDAF